MISKMAVVVYLNVTSGIQPETKKIYMSDKRVTPFININNYRVIILSDQYNMSLPAAIPTRVWAAVSQLQFI
jgi:hypothetical protein